MPQLPYRPSPEVIVRLNGVMDELHTTIDESEYDSGLIESVEREDADDEGELPSMTVTLADGSAYAVWVTEIRPPTR